MFLTEHVISIIHIGTTHEKCKVNFLDQALTSCPLQNKVKRINTFKSFEILYIYNNIQSTVLKMKILEMIREGNLKSHFAYD